MSRVPHPKCKQCGHPLYKTIKGVRPKKSQPYVICRNKDCKSLKTSSKKESKKIKEGCIKLVVPNKEIRENTIVNNEKKWTFKIGPIVLCEKCGKAYCDHSGESDEVIKHREEIKNILKNGTSEVKKSLLLFASILLQEIGNSSGNEIIEEYSLEEYGVNMMITTDKEFLDHCLASSKAGKHFTGEQCARLCFLYGDVEMAEKYRRMPMRTRIEYGVMTDIVNSIKNNPIFS